MQGRAKTCRYLVLLGLDPSVPDAEGADAFKLSENHTQVAPALALGQALRRTIDAADRGRRSTATQRHHVTVAGSERRWGLEAGGGGGASGPGGKGVRRAPTAGAGIEEGMEKAGWRGVEEGDKSREWMLRTGNGFSGNFVQSLLLYAIVMKELDFVGDFD